MAITAAMPSGTGLDKFAERFPDRTFDVGIAEQHGVTFAAGLATEGFKPFAAIYSTFLQRAYDQVVHDVAIQKLPVRFAIDRAGLVGADGATHAGSFDVAYLGCLPDFVVMAAADELELMHMVATAAADRRPALGLPLSARRGRRRRAAGARHAAGDRQGPHRARRHQDRAPELRHAPAANAWWRPRISRAKGLSTTVADARFAKPLDTDLIRRLAREHEVLITIEEGSVGGFASQVLQYLASSGPARSRPESAADDPARPLHRPRGAGQAVRAGRPQRAGDRGDRPRRARPISSCRTAASGPPHKEKRARGALSIAGAAE